MYVLPKVLILQREDEETTASWTHRLHKGSTRVSDLMSTNLSDECYREVRREEGRSD